MSKYLTAIVSFIFLTNNGAWAKPADYVFTGGKIYTMNDEQPTAEESLVSSSQLSVTPPIFTLQ